MRIICCLLLALIGGYPPAFTQSAAEKQILDTELKRFEAMVSRDTPALLFLLDDELYYLHSNGVAESKKQHLAAIASGSLVYSSIARLPDVTVRQYGKFALVNGVVCVTVEINGATFSANLKYTAVYRKRKQRWLLLNWQTTRVQTE